ncbi:MAG: PilZ domain-containing protein [Thermoanaerobaculia bacterium]|jgi:DNA-binding response OmpR family regulator
MDPGTIVLVTPDRAGLGVEGLLLRRGDAVVVVPNGASAIALLPSRRPRLVVLQQNLGDMDVPHFCRIVRDGPDTRSVSLLLIADEGDEAIAALSLAAGCNDVIHRPVDEEDLDSRVARLSSVPARKELRTLVKLELSMERAGQFFLGHSMNISSRGMLVQTNQILAPEARVILQFYLQNDPVPMRVEALVVRAEFLGGSARYGMKFIDLGTDDDSRLAAFIERLRRTGRIA